MTRSEAQIEADRELAAQAQARLDATGARPTRDELAAIDRLLIDQARARLAKEPQQQAKKIAK
jgi:hypothetical protein